MLRSAPCVGLWLVGVWLATSVAVASPFVSEIHYDNAGVDAGEAVELFGEAGFDLTGWQLVLYNGASGLPYSSIQLEGALPDERQGYGTFVVRFASNGLQNGPDGIALIDSEFGVVEFLSYEGAFTAAAGPAAGLTSIDIGVRETASTPPGHSLQRGGASPRQDERVWLDDQPESLGAINLGQGLSIAWPFVAIAELQGRGHRSPWRGQGVRTSGVVTFVTSDGFYLQDPFGDGASATSEAVFALTNAASGLRIGDVPILSGIVRELAPGGPAAAELSTTAVAVSRIDELLTPATLLPAPVLVGIQGRRPPGETVDDDALSLFEPEFDGIDFWESLEGMRVELPGAVSVSATNFFNETFAVADAGDGVSGIGARGALVGSAEDANPERLKIHESRAWTGEPPGIAQLGDALGTVEGVIDYAFGSFELRATRPLRIVPNLLSSERSTLEFRPGSLTLASYNLRNFGPGDSARDGAIARHIVDHLLSPNVIALQEMQDDDGPANTGETRATRNALRLIAAIEQAGGPRYSYVEQAPEDGADGGQPGANIRVGFLYDEAHVALIAGSVERLLDRDLSDGDAFLRSRKPLAISIRAVGRRITLVGVHFTSRRGGTPVFGSRQPPIVGGAERRIEQSAVVAAWVDGLQAADPEALVVVLGDMNEVSHAPPLERLSGSSPRLHDLESRVSPGERYSFIFDGNADLLDHIFVSPALFPHSQFDVVHLNTGLQGAASDHDPLLARIDIAAIPEPATNLLRTTLLCTLFLLRRGVSNRLMRTTRPECRQA